MRTILLLFFLLSFGQAEAQESSSLLNDSKDDYFEVGQKWKYKTRKSEKGSIITILKIEESVYETIIHVAINGLNLQNEGAHNGVSQNIRHLTFSKSALEKSVTKLKKKKCPLPEFQHGYKQWKRAYFNAESGYFGIPVKDALDVIENSMTN